MNRRGFIAGLAAAIAAPAVIRTPGLLMPVRKVLRGPITAAEILALQEAALARFAPIWDDALSDLLVFGTAIIQSDRFGMPLRTVDPFTAKFDPKTMERYVSPPTDDLKEFLLARESAA